MLPFPAHTRYGKSVTKQKLYDHIAFSTAEKQALIHKIHRIIWRNKIAPSTMDLAPGQYVAELEIFEIQLNQPSISESILRLIDNAIPYHILFLLSWNGRCQAWMGYKDKTAPDTLKVSRYYHTKWMPEDQLPLRLTGLTTDAVYENFLRQLAGPALDCHPESLRQAVAQDTRRERLEKQILSLQKKLYREKQANRQLSIFDRIRSLKKELTQLLDQK